MAEFADPQPVLIVEDDPDVVACLELLVQSYFGRPTLVENDGAAALDVARTEHPSLVLLDLALPGADGLRICATLKRHSASRSIPVVIVSSSAAGLEETRRQARDAGCDVFFHKLYDFHRLVPILSHYLEDARAS